MLQAVGQIPTQTTVTSSSPTSTYGQSVTLTATVTPTASASDNPSGTVTFYDDESTPIATVGVSTAAGTATASLDISSLMGGLHFHHGDLQRGPDLRPSSSSAPVIVDVAEAATTVTVASSADPSVVGQAVVFTASISSSAPGETGTVQFADNGFMIGSGAVSGGQATFETVSLALGAHPITAVYEGDDDFVGSSSTNTITQTVGPAATSTEVTSSARPGPGRTDHRLHRNGRRRRRPGPARRRAPCRSATVGIPIPACQGLALPPHRHPSSRAPRPTTRPPARTSRSPTAVTPNFTASAGAMTENVSPVSTTTALVPSPARRHRVRA